MIDRIAELDAINRTRVLTREESDELCRLIARERKTRLERERKARKRARAA